MMLCRLGALDKLPRVHPVWIGETFRRAIAKIVMRAAGDQTKTACGYLQLCAGIEASIEGATHALAQQQREKIAPVTGERDSKDSDEERAMGEDNNGRREDEAAVRGAGEGLVRQPRGDVTVNGEVSDELRTAMEDVEVVEEETA